MSFADWLKGLDLGQYAQAFADNDIDLALAARLTDADLKEIGVASLGHRRKLLAAAAALTAKPPAPQAPAARPRRRASSDHGDVLRPRGLDEPRGAARSRGLAQSGGELSRRRLGRRDFARRPRAEEARRRADGVVRLSPGAGERRRARCARRARDPARARRPQRTQRRERRAGARRAHRAGQRAGRGRFAGEVYGEAPNVAARVQSAAAPGEIWITRAVHRQIAGLFVAEDKGEHELKGVPEKTQLYRIVRASGGGRRGGSRAPTPLVGRGEELDILDAPLGARAPRRGSALADRRRARASANRG